MSSTSAFIHAYGRRFAFVCARARTHSPITKCTMRMWKFERETGANWNRIGDCCYETQVSEKNKNASHLFAYMMWSERECTHITHAQLHACMRRVCVCTFHGSQNTKWNGRVREKCKGANDKDSKSPTHTCIHNTQCMVETEMEASIATDGKKEWERYFESSEACEQECCGSMCLMHD